MRNMSLDEVLELLRRTCERAGGQREFARTSKKVSAQYVSQVLARKQEPGPALLEALGLEREYVYRRIP